MVSIDKSTKTNDIWKNFYDRIKSQVTSVQTNLIEVGTTTIKTYASSYSDILLDNKDNYPIIVVEDPELPSEPFTFKKAQIEGTINVSVFSRQNIAAVKFKDKIIDSIETYKAELAKVGIKGIEIDDTDSDNFKRGALNIHMRLVRFNFKYRYSRESGF